MASLPPAVALHQSPKSIGLVALHQPPKSIGLPCLMCCRSISDSGKSGLRFRRTALPSSRSPIVSLRLVAPLRRSSPLFCFRAALNDTASPESEVFQGIYGTWSVDSTDVREVLLYRGGLVATAVAFIIAASRAFLPQDNPIQSIVEQYSDILYSIGAGGLGLSLLLIHIYVTPIKRTLQLLWAFGVLGSIIVALNFAAPANESLVNYVLENRWAIWLVGPLFAALTGLVFKEGLCYGKLEAGVLVFVIPGLLLGHLSGAVDEKIELALLVAWMVLYTVFTTRKFTQAIKDDIGDKSVFIFNALPEKEKKAVLLKIQEQTKMDGGE